MTSPIYQIRPMIRPELDLAVQWAAREGWNPGLHDADSFFAADPGGFLIGLLDGRPIACISAVRYEPGFGFIGFYIVLPEFRGKGYGIRIWNAAMERLEGRLIGLDGVVAQQDNYRKSGFEYASPNVRYQGTCGGSVTRDAAIQPLSRFPAEELECYDQRFFPAGRSTFLRSWVRQSGSIAAGVGREGKLAGYGVIRPCREGYKIGPLFADQPADAERLFLHLRAHATPGAPVFLDIPRTNPAAVKLVLKHGLAPVFETARMHRPGPVPPAIDWAGVYGITSFELG